MKPLTGVRVLDLSRFLPGPFCTMLLASLGADVIKVENPILGDPGRLAPPFIGGHSVTFRALNLHKRSIAVNYRSAEGREILAELVGRADVFVESFKPGYTERLGLGFSAAKAWNPRIVYCSLSGFGHEGHMADRSGHDLNFLARSGLLDLLRDQQEEPVVPGVTLADMAGGLNAGLAILAALFAARSSGTGSHLNVSILGGATNLLTLAIAEALLVSRDPSAHPSPLSGAYPSYGLYRTADNRHISVGIIEPNVWAELCKVLGRKDLVQGQYPNSEGERERRRAEVAAIFASKTQAEWAEFLVDSDVCCDPVLGVTEAAANLAAGDCGSSRQDDVAWVFPDHPEYMRRLRDQTIRAPELGAHTLEILEWLAVSPERVSELRSRRVVATPEDTQPARHTSIF